MSLDDSKDRGGYTIETLFPKHDDPPPWHDSNAARAATQEITWAETFKRHEKELWGYDLETLERPPLVEALLDAYNLRNSIPSLSDMIADLQKRMNEVCLLPPELYGKLKEQTATEHTINQSDTIHYEPYGVEVRVDRNIPEGRLYFVNRQALDDLMRKDFQAAMEKLWNTPL